MEDLNCSIEVKFNCYPEVTLELDFKLFLMKEKEDDILKYKEYQIKGINTEDTHCYLKYEVIEKKNQGGNKNIPSETNIIYIKDINVYKDFRKQGISTKMYELLSDIYMKNHYNYQINRKFVNPYAEYAFRKAVQEKKVDKLLLLNSKIEREYDSSEKGILKDLMKQLAPEYRDEL
ncbi:hypothetical protein COJ62_15985 [Bacillus cereus]|nr:hypothetical protein COJ62_15985 [Bacillus cereus]